MLKQGTRNIQKWKCLALLAPVWIVFGFFILCRCLKMTLFWCTQFFIDFLPLLRFSVLELSDSCWPFMNSTLLWVLQSILPYSWSLGNISHSSSICMQLLNLQLFCGSRIIQLNIFLPFFSFRYKPDSQYIAFLRV